MCWTQRARLTTPHTLAPQRMWPASHPCVSGLAAGRPWHGGICGALGCSKRALEESTYPSGLPSVAGSLACSGPQPFLHPPALCTRASLSSQDCGGGRGRLITMYEPEPWEFVRECDVR